jgi:uncharacterized phiE125 gp8 family phage protein
MVVTLAKLKSHLWTIGIDADDDYIQDLCLTAMSYLEDQLNTSLVRRSHTLVIERFPYFWQSMNQMIPAMTGIVLPVWPIGTITSLTYVDIFAGTQSIDPTTLQIRNYKPPSIFPKVGNVWPFSNPQQVANVSITFTAGYATIPDIPMSILHCVKLLVAHWYKNRETASQALLQQMPFGIDELIRTNKWWW